MTVNTRILKSQQGLSAPVLIISGVTVALFVIIALFMVRRIQLEWSPSLKNIRNLIDKKKYSEAFRLIETAEQEQGANASLLVEKGKIWFSLALDLETRSRWSSYGTDERDWLKSQEADKAEGYLRKALELDPSSKDAHYYLGLLCIEKGWFSLAETEFVSVLRHDRKHVLALINLGVVYTEMRRFDLAELELHNAWKLDHREPAVAKNLAYLYRFYLDKPDSAIVWANRYLNLDPQNDIDLNIVRQELKSLLLRYPEFTPAEPMNWQKEPKFKSRAAKK